MGTIYNTSKKPTVLENSLNAEEKTRAYVYSDGTVIFESSLGSDKRKFGSRPTAIRQLFGGPGGWRIIEG